MHVSNELECQQRRYCRTPAAAGAGLRLGAPAAAARELCGCWGPAAAAAGAAARFRRPGRDLTGK